MGVEEVVCSHEFLQDTPTSLLEVDICFYHVNIRPSNYYQRNQK